MSAVLAIIARTADIGGGDSEPFPYLVQVSQNPTPESSGKMGRATISPTWKAELFKRERGEGIIFLPIIQTFV